MRDDHHRGAARSVAPVAVLGALVLAGWLLATPGNGDDDAPPAADPLAARGYAVTGGAAPGYVEDRLCASCHPDLYASYQEVGMARSFYRPRASNLIEDFAAEPYLHEPSGRYYEMRHRGGGRLAMRRYQLDAEGRPINEVEQPVDWILGSGNHVRTYLFRTPSGELFQLPIAWYTRTASWAMAPGFDRADHLGIQRPVPRECMFCHNAYPDVPAGSDAHAEPRVFPETLPEGIGCQRCHGPGADHARAAMGGAAGNDIDFEAVFATVVDPTDLPPRLRDDVCYQCHMQPTVAIPGQRLFGRGTYSFRPGQALVDYVLGVDVVEAGRERGERFEINHHPYRLEQSRCFTASAGAMSCLTCHDPHRKVPAAERAAHYRAACLSCHQVDACSLEEMAAAAEHPAMPAVADDDCVGCHMPKRRTEDVVRVVMTDHLIRRRPGGPELLAPIAETEPDIDDVVYRDPASAPAGALGDLYRAYTVAELTGGDHAAAIAALEALLGELRPQALEPYLALAKGQLEQRRIPALVATLDEVLGRAPDHPRASQMLAIVQDGMGRRDEALATLRGALERYPDRSETHHNLGTLLLRYGRPAEALAHLERAVALRPNMDRAWLQLGEARSALGRRGPAVDAYRRALAIAPDYSHAYLALGRTLLRLDRREEALRYLRHGVAHAKDPTAIAAVLAQAERASEAEP